ncbi:FecR domain-containing protein [uncultured Draconibacterium sp.]|uniref:FecR family protein n=1 Tax=uncultured Draconibacterium sp. TaxID=1573823 RepID=UPI0029C8A7F6|nr:FecR domain-containing protein [uncultured Draconibacterium sp.]
MQEYNSYDRDDFIQDSYFQEWIIDQTFQSICDWEKYCKDHPYQLAKIIKAKSFLKQLKTEEPVLSEDRLNDLYLRIKKERGRMRKKGRSRILHIGIAATFLMVVGIGAIFFHEKDQQDIVFSGQFSEEAKLILSDGTVKLLDDDSDIRMGAEKSIFVNEDTIHIKNETPVQELQQVLIPCGKRSKIQLSDGSIIYLNSGSRVKYPVSFSGNKREIYAEGELFFEIAKNKERPFIVHFPQIDVKVTGTRFNVTAYPDEEQIQTVLVSGGVTVSRSNFLGKERLKLIPGECATLNSGEKNFTITNVNVEDYITWIDGYYIFQNTPLENVINKLIRYYNTPIDLIDVPSETTFSGKLDLADELDTVLHNLTFSSSAEVQKLSHGYKLIFN